MVITETAWAELAGKGTGWFLFAVACGVIAYMWRTWRADVKELQGKLDVQKDKHLADALQTGLTAKELIHTVDYMIKSGRLAHEPQPQRRR